MEFSQSKGPNRGALIAVIKIQLAPDKSDRIFLHQNDNDYLLASQFQQKHNLKLSLIDLIYQRIKLSRATLNQFQQSSKSQQTPPVAQRPSYQLEQLSNKLSAPKTQQFAQSNYKNTSFDNNDALYSNIDHKFQKKIVQRTVSKFAQNQLTKATVEIKNNSRVGYIYNNQTKQQTALNDFHIQPQFNQMKNNNDILQNTNKNQQPQSYSFDQNKPSRVKVIRKEQMSQIQNSLKRSLSKAEIRKITSDVTNRLYNKSDIKKGYLKIIKQQAKIDKDDKQKQQLTYKPVINPISSAIANERLKNKPIYEHLIDQGKKAQIKKQHVKSIISQKQLNGCSFHPQMNQISKKLVERRSVSDLAKPKPPPRNPSTQKMFKPQINKFSEQIIKSKGNFDQRLKTFLQQKNQKLNLKARQKRIQETIDLSSGQQLFRPRITTTSSNVPKGENIGEYLHNLSKQQKIIPTNNPMPKINMHSQQLVQQLYMKRLAWIFAELDSDHDGFISPQSICISNIDDDLLEVMMPVLYEMEEMKIELNLTDFRKAIQNLHNSLTALQKSILYDYKKKKTM